MKTYLISLYSPPGPPPEDLDLTRVMADLEVVNDDIRAAGGWVFAGGLGDLESATVIRSRGETVVTDGPFLEVKEHLGGISIVRAPDLDVVGVLLERGRPIMKYVTLALLLTVGYLSANPPASNPPAGIDSK